MVRKVTICTRLSAPDQPIDNQLGELTSYCDRMGYEVVKVHENEVSSSKAREKRPVLNAHIKDAYRKRFDSVVCWKISELEDRWRNWFCSCQI